MAEAVDDGGDASPAPAASWTDEDGPSYAVHRCDARPAWVRPVAACAVVALVLAGVAVALLLTATA